MVPNLFELHRTPETASIATVLLGLTLYTWPGSAVEFLNGLSYAVLGIPSIVFSVIMFCRVNAFRAGKVLLALSGILSMIALIALILIGQVLVRQPAKQAT